VGKSHVPNPLVTINMSKKEKGGIQEKTLSLEELSLSIAARFEINAMCTHYNATNTLYL
jgi:hypothetical protein